MQLVREIILRENWEMGEREYAGEFTALEWPLVFVAFEKGLVY